MGRFCLLLPMVASFLCCSAQEGSNWVLGLKGGIDFNYNPAKAFLSSVITYSNNPSHDTVSARWPQAVSDCSGRLMYYVGGDSMVWNREHKLLPSNGLLKNNNQSCFFIPAPDNDSFMYLFQFPMVQDTSLKPRYTIIGNYLDSGRGDILSPEVKFADSIGSLAGYIKHANGVDYWIIYKPSNYTMHAYQLTKNGVSKNPIISSCKGRRQGQGNYPYMRSSNNGQFIITVSDNGSGYPPYYMYNFDKATGKFSNPKLIFPASSNVHNPVTFAFSPNDSIIYAFALRPLAPKYDTSYIYQLHTYDSLPFNTAKIVFRITGTFSHQMQLGQDNRLYSDQGRSFLKYPDVWGVGCELVYNGFSFVQGTNGGSNVFPCHSYPVKRINPKFSVTSVDGCGYDSTRFKFDGDSSFSSAWWYFGDGDSALENPTVNAGGQKVWPGVVHQYTNPGSYYVRLACTSGPCGYRQWVGDSITLKFKPNLGLQKTKDAYTCGGHNMEMKLAWKYADTVKFWRGDGTDTTMAVGYSTNADSTIFSNSFGTGKYIIAAKAWNAECMDSTAFNESINIDPVISPVFGVNALGSCSSSTFDFMDTTGYDSTVLDRHWLVHYPSGKDSLVYTVNTDSMNIYLDEAGKYDVKLVRSTRQGCLDSLEKMQYVSVLSPLSISITPSSKYTCGKNTLDLDLIYRYADTLHLWLNGKDSSFAVTNSTNPTTISQTHAWQIQIPASTGMTVMDTFAVRATNSQCSDSVSYIHTVIIDPPAKASFQTNNFASCGSSTFTFSDTSHLDSIVAKRLWNVTLNSFQGLFDTTLTTSQNYINITLQDTGNYTVTLTQTTRQGCVDSLTKPAFIRVNPLPEPVITAPSVLCYNDSVTLSVPALPAGRVERYLWSTGDTTQSIVVKKSGTYSVQVWNKYNCKGTSNAVKVTALPPFNVIITHGHDTLGTQSSRQAVSFLWLRDGSSFTGNTDPEIYAPANGSYTVEVTDSNGCKAKSQVYKYTTGLSVIGYKLPVLRLYPNPTGSVLYIEFNPDNRQPITDNRITITDLAGKQILSIYSIPIAIGSETTVPINIDQLASGVYILEVAGQHLKFVKE